VRPSAWTGRCAARADRRRHRPPGASRAPRVPSHRQGYGDLMYIGIGTLIIIIILLIILL
jgi:hypothetical protein